MKKIEIEDDVYNYLVSNTVEIGESATSILRRLLNLSPGVSTGDSKSPNSLSILDEFLNSKRYKRHYKAIGQFLEILSWIYEQNPEEFDAVTNIEGRKRKYFSKSWGDLINSGLSVAPAQIPESDYYVVTNNSIQMKRQIIRRVLELLKYDPLEIRKVMTSFQISKA
jgi:negative modulator of initiation of replication